jgi:hypothetical protein
MPHTFNNNHTIRHSHNGTLPTNHKATRMHTKINLNKPQIYFDDPNLSTYGQVDVASIVRIERMLEEDKKILSYLKETKTTHPEQLLFLNSDFGIDNVKHIDEWIDEYTSYCEQLESVIDMMDELASYPIIVDAVSDFSILPKKTHKKSSHRISREKSLPKSRLERQIKKQVFFKKSRKVEKDIVEDIEDEIEEDEIEEDEEEYDQFDKDERDLEMFRYMMMYSY